MSEWEHEDSLAKASSITLCPSSPRILDGDEIKVSSKQHDPIQITINTEDLKGSLSKELLRRLEKTQKSLAKARLELALAKKADRDRRNAEKEADRVRRNKDRKRKEARIKKSQSKSRLGKFLWKWPIKEPYLIGVAIAAQYFFTNPSAFPSGMFSSMFSHYTPINTCPNPNLLYPSGRLDSGPLFPKLLLPSPPPVPTCLPDATSASTSMPAFLSPTATLPDPSPTYFFIPTPAPEEIAEPIEIISTPEVTPITTRSGRLWAALQKREGMSKTTNVPTKIVNLNESFICPTTTMAGISWPSCL